MDSAHGRPSATPRYRYVATLLLLNCCTNLVLTPVSGETVNANASAVVDGRAELPCDITPPSADDKTLLVLWYKEGTDNPIFSLDLRGKSTDTTLTFSPEDIRSRSAFHSDTTPSHLRVDKVREEDQGVFRCRVDFRKAPTRNYVVNLGVIVPPMTPTILGEKGQELSTSVGPYNEGVSFFLSCEVVGGRPPPRVTWWRGSTMLDDSYEVTSLGIVRNDLVIQSLTRHDFNAVFVCHASNNNITPPAVTSISVDMNLKPLDVKIVNELRPLSANKRYELVCQSSGSKPPPIIAWYKGNRRLKRTEETISPDTNITTSILTMSPTTDDHGKQLTCKAENPAIPASGIHDVWQLNIYYSPMARLELGSSLKTNNLREGDDVFLECIIQSNPTSTRTRWMFQEKPLPHNVTSGIIISNQSLVLQKVKRTNSGPYSCIAYNVEGSGESNVIHLKIKHVPVCKAKQQTLFEIARNEEAKIICEVEAYPVDVNFRWAMNGSRRVVDEGKARASTQGTQSTLVYNPKSPKDFGIFHCWASNEMGEQQVPCAFTLTPAGPPDPAYNCSVSNQTESSLVVVCLPGYNGGLPQTFVCEIIDASTRQMLTTLTNSSPIFYLIDLPSKMHFVLFIFASNARGRSDVVMVTANTSKSNKQQAVPTSWLLIILGAVMGLVVALSLLGIAVIFIARLRSSQRRKKKICQPEQVDRCRVHLQRVIADDNEDGEEKSPDLIPNSSEEFPSVKVRCLQPKWAHSKDIPCESCLGGSLSISGSPPVLEGVNGYRPQIRKIMPYEEPLCYDTALYQHHHPNSKTLLHSSFHTMPSEPLHMSTYHKCHRTGDLRPQVHHEDDQSTAETPLMSGQHESTV